MAIFRVGEASSNDAHRDRTWTVMVVAGVAKPDTAQPPRANTNAHRQATRVIANIHAATAHRRLPWHARETRA